jgi:hypothetical protein
MTLLAMLGDAPRVRIRATEARMRRADVDRGEGRPKECLFKKISILISAHGSTAGRGLFLPDVTAVR